MNCTREDVISIQCKKHNLANKQIDTDCGQLNGKLCDLIYLLVALIFCHIWRSITTRKSHLSTCRCDKSGTVLSRIIDPKNVNRKDNHAAAF